jgi:hypothetical protein
MVVNLAGKTPFSKLLTTAQKRKMSLQFKAQGPKVHVKPETTTSDPIPERGFYHPCGGHYGKYWWKNPGYN